MKNAECQQRDIRSIDGGQKFDKLLASSGSADDPRAFVASTGASKSCSFLQCTNASLPISASGEGSVTLSGFRQP